MVECWRSTVQPEFAPTPSYCGPSSSSASTDSGGPMQMGYSPIATFQPPHMDPYGVMAPGAGSSMAPEGTAPDMLMPPPTYHSGPPTMMSYGAPMMTPMVSHDGHPFYPPFFTPPMPSPHVPEQDPNGYFVQPSNIVHHTFASGMQMYHDTSTGRYAFYPVDAEPPMPTQQDDFTAPMATQKTLRHANSYNEQMLQARRSNRSLYNKLPRMQAARRSSEI